MTTSWTIPITLNNQYNILQCLCLFGWCHQVVRHSQGRFTVVFDLLMLKSQVNLELEGFTSTLSLPVTWKQTPPLAFFDKLLCELDRVLMVNVNNKQWAIYNQSLMLCSVTFPPHPALYNNWKSSCSIQLAFLKNVQTALCCRGSKEKVSWATRLCYIHLLSENIPVTPPLLSVQTFRWVSTQKLSSYSMSMSGCHLNKPLRP